MRQPQRLYWTLGLVILILGLVGCELIDSGNVGPTDPADMTQLSNFWVGRGQDKLGVYQEKGFVQVSVPAGSYLLTYTTDLGTFFIVFSSEEGALLALGLQEGDTLRSITLQQGTIPDTVTPTQTQEGVSIYYWPGDDTEEVDLVAFLAEIFTSDPDVEEIILVEEGEVTGPEYEPKRTITVNVTGSGTVTPSGTFTRPKGSSQMFIFETYANLIDVKINEQSVMPAVEELGNGNGHLVVHSIDTDLTIDVEFQ